MKSYTLNELSTIFYNRYHLTKDRFMYYFTTRYGYSERDALEAYLLYSSFPRIISQGESKQEEINKLDIILPQATEVVESFLSSWELRPKNIDSYDKELKKIYYKVAEDTPVKELIIDVFKSEDIITYADILKSKPIIIAMLSLCKTISYQDANNQSQELHVFEGDIYDTKDKFYGNKSTLYVAETDNTFRALLYTKGKGYLYKGEPNYNDDGKYNSHVLTGYEFHKLGNIHIDLHVLTDNGVVD